MNENKIPYGAQTRFSVFDNTMAEMTWQEVQAGSDREAIVLLPIGTVEAHGPHLDLTADFYLSTLNCRYLKQELGERGIEALITPPFFWGISRDVARYAGTFSVRPETMKALLMDILMSLKSWGFRRIFIQNAHGDPMHIEIIKSAIAEANGHPDFRVYFMWELGIEIEHNITFPQMREERFQHDYHAGAIETAQMVTFFPEKVRCNVAKALEPSDSFHPLAYCGDPASYDQEYNISQFTKSDVDIDVLKIEAILKRDGR